MFLQTINLIDLKSTLLIVIRVILQSAMVVKLVQKLLFV